MRLLPGERKPVGVQQLIHCDGWTQDVRHCTDGLIDSELSWIRGITSQLNVDLLADIHPGSQPEIHAVGTVDELLKFLCCDAFAHFPDTKGRTFWPNRAKGVVVETRL